jgi:hypothetical protein
MVKIWWFQDPKYHDVYALYNIETFLNESELNAMVYNIAHSLEEANIEGGDYDAKKH